ncbi:helix-turn-helix transcriptional regulator [Chloroflexota bacterium]
MVRVGLKREAFEVAITRRNLSQKGLAERLHISRSYLSEIVRGKRKPSAAMRERFLEYFREYTFDDLFIIEKGGNGDRSEA